MRIALVAPLVSAIAQPYLGGTQALLADLAQGLLRRGHSVTLFARDDSFVPGIQIEPVVVPREVQPANFSEERERPADTSFFTKQTSFSIYSCNYKIAALNLTLSMCTRLTGQPMPAAC